MIARMRAEAEDVYGMRLGEIGTATDRITDGFSRDDGASVRKVNLVDLYLTSIPLTGSIGIRWSSNRNGGGSQKSPKDRAKHS